MVTLTTVELLEEALGKTLEGAELQAAEYYIKLISTYILSYTGLIFDDDESPGEVKTVRMKADYYGIIDLSGGAIESVESVKMWGSQGEHLSWHWDGLDQVFGLRAQEVVDITYTVGETAIPNDLQMVATEATKKLFDSPSGEPTGPATRYRVGDVEEGYRAVDLGSLGGYFNDFEKLILNRYRPTVGTLHLGFAQQPDFRGLPAEGSNSIVE